MFVSSAFAQDVAATQEASGFMGLIPFVAMFAIFYFLILRPQQKRYKQHQLMLNAISKGDEIVTGGGIIGKVVTIEDGDILKVSIADNVVVKIARSSVSGTAQQPISTEADVHTSHVSKKKNKKSTIANDN